MDQRAIIDVICKAGLGNLSTEIGALLGQDLNCSDFHLDLTTKADIFSNLEREKTALTRMKVGGDKEGQCYLLTRISAAVVLGGTLIMLPDDVIEENAKSKKLDGELSDAFGEVANIIAGVFTQTFVEKYRKTLRFIKESVEELIPTKIDLDADLPFAPGNYYLASCKMTLEEQDLGLLEFVVPAAIFDLEQGEPATKDVTTEASPAPQADEQTAPVSAATAAEAAAPDTQSNAATAPAAPSAPQTPAKPRSSFADAKKIADVVFKATIAQAGEETGALLGQPLKCDDIQLLLVSKSDFFSSHCVEKSILTHMKVTGDSQGLGFMVTQIPDAVILGGTLIMLPEDQIEEHKNAGVFEGEVADAFGEIANIMAGSLTQVFLDRYPRQLRFIKTDTEVVVPTKIDPAAEEPFPEGQYYLASFAIHLDDYDLHRVHFLFPAAIFDLDGQTADPAEGSAKAATSTSDQGTAASSTAASQQGGGPAPGEWGGPPLPESEQPVTGQKAGSTGQQASPAPHTATTAVSGENSGAKGSPLILIISDQENNAAPFVEILTSAGYQCQTLTFQDEVKEFFQTHQILGIFLLMAQVGEKGFAAAIKLQAAGRPLPPIIFAGPEWTRSAVLRAVKYGAKDILILPASGAEIQDKVSQHIKKAS